MHAQVKLMVDTNTRFIFYSLGFGSCIGLFIQNMIHATTIFGKKSNLIFYLIILGLVNCIIQGLITFLLTVELIAPDLRFGFRIVTNLLWFALIQLVTWLYILRIKSLGDYMPFDKWIYLMSPIVALVQVPSMILNLIDSDVLGTSTELKYTYFVIARTVYTVTITVVDVALYIFLLKKLNFILEFRQHMVKKLGFHLKISMACVTFVEIALGVVRIIFPIDYTVTPSIYLIKLYIIIQFYGELVDNVTCDTGLVMT